MTQEKTLSFRRKKKTDKLYVLYIPDERVKEYVDAIRYISSPDQKHSGHITVRGPYKNKIPVDKINKNFSGNQITITGVGNFFDCDQNTVFFKCKGTFLEKVWEKRDYDDYLPHITIYDGDDKQFAEHLFNTIKQFHYNITYKADKLELLKGQTGQKSAELGLNHSMDIYKNASDINNLNLSDLKRKPESERLKIIKYLCRQLSELSDASSEF